MHRRLWRLLAVALLTLAAFWVLCAPAQAADRDCPDFATHEDAQRYFDAHGGSPVNNIDDLDRDHDGLACEALPHAPASTAGTATAGGSGTGTADETGAIPPTGPGAASGGTSGTTTTGRTAPELPFTGGSHDTQLLLAGAGLLALGAGLVWRLRHRPTH